MKNILVMTGSPRKNGNSDLMADAFIEGAMKKGHTVNKFDTAFKKIAGCRACDKCWSTGSACVIKDDFNELEKMLEEADMIIFVSPIYWFGISAQIKAAIDRIYAYTSASAKANLKIKESGYLLCAGDSMEGMNVFDGAIKTFELMDKYMYWENRANLLVPAVLAKGDILKTESIKKAKEIGLNI